MMYLKRFSLFFAVALLLVTAYGHKDAKAIQVFTRGTNVSAYTFTLLSGETIKMSDYIGKKCVLIEFWADYCADCTDFMKEIEQLSAKKMYPEIEYLGLVCEWGVPHKNAVDYVDRHKISFQQIWIKKSDAGFRPSKDKKVKSAMEYSLPKRVLIDKTGHVIVEDREKVKGSDVIKNHLIRILSGCSEGNENVL